MAGLFDDQPDDADFIYDDDEREDAALNDDDLATDDLLQSRKTKLLPAHLNPSCLGHEVQEKLFLDLFDKGSLPHAMIFTGIKGIGKATMAFRLARFLLKHGAPQADSVSLFENMQGVLPHTSLAVDEKDPVFSRVASGGHTDFRYFDRGVSSESGKAENSLRIEKVRKIEPFLRLRASNDGWRVIILDDADTMTNQAQNAILKILEEPPPKTLIILIAHQCELIIPTIRSRARVVRFDPLDSQTLLTLLAQQNISASGYELALIEKIAEGSIGHALRLTEGGGLEILRSILNLLDLPEFPDHVALHDFANALHAGGQDQEYRIFTEMMEWIMREIIKRKAKGFSDFPPYLNNARLLSIMRANPLEKLMTIYDDLKSLFARTDFSNLDRREAVRGGFLMISQ